MEGTHRKLCTRFTDGLRSDDPHGLAYLHRLTSRHVGAVTFRTDTNMGFAGKDRTDLHLRLISGIDDRFCIYNSRRTLRCDHMICLHDEVALIIIHIFTGIAPGNSFL